MLCAKYDYKMDIAVKQEEARAEGKQAGILEGQQKKAVEDARNFYVNGASIELISKSMNMTPEQVKEIVKDLVPVV